MDADGKRRRKHVNVKGTKKDADRRRRELLTSLDKGAPIDATKITVAELLERWMHDYVVTNTRPRTVMSYESIIRTHLLPAFGSLPLSRLQVVDVQALEARLIEEGKSPTTVVHIHNVLSGALKQAVVWGFVWRNVCDPVTPPKQDRREILMPDIQKVRNALALAKETRHYSALMFAAYTGCRRGEVVGLRWQDVDLDRAKASITQTFQRITGQGLVAQPPKSKKGRRSITLDPATVLLLRTHKTAQLEDRMRFGAAYEDRDLVFSSPLGQPLDPGHLTHAWESIRERADLGKMRLHDLRHFHATLLMREGTHPRVVQERLGHSTIALTLDTYSHVLPGLQEKAALAFADAMDQPIAEAL